tara:strand:- start:17325 stop:18293 length:969 start_codon:yes stop_codon:yes gene_type:complete
MTTINWGIIGLGKIANSFATDLMTVEGSTLYGVASRSQEKANEFGEKYGAAKKYDSYEALAKDPAIDVIYIATPHVKHYEDTMMCLSHGKAVLCEKPFAMNSDQVDKMIALAEEKGCLLMEALWTRMMPHFNFVLDEIESGKYGAVKTVNADFCFEAPFDPQGRLFNKELGGGSLLDVGIYPVFCALAILGKPENISAKAKFGKTEVDEETQITLTYKNGSKAHIISSITRKTPSTATIILEKGLINIESRFHETDKVTTVLDGVKLYHDFAYSAKGYNFEAAHVGDLLRAGKTESPMMSREFSRLIINTLDEVRKLINLHY